MKSEGVVFSVVSECTPTVRRKSSLKMKPHCTEPEHGQLNTMDRLSDLPDFILHQIIYYLGFKEACRTCTLSKRWTYISDTNPNMELSHHVFSAHPSLWDWDNSMVKVENFLKYIETRMQRYSKHSLRINKLTLGFPALRITLPNTDQMLIYKVDEWVEIAVRKQVTEIAICGPANYQLHGILLTSKSLRCLDCSYLEIPYSCTTTMNLRSLESLCLDNAYLEERTLNHIIGSCLLLKKLRLYTCSGIELAQRLKSIVIPCSSKLEMLDLTDSLSKDGTVIIDTSSLTSFQYVGLLHSGDERWAVISKDGFLRNLRMLEIGFVSIANEVLGKLLSELIFLETLKLCNCSMLSTIRISSALLKEIRLEYCADLLDVSVDAPCLKTFIYEGDFKLSARITINSQVGCDISLYIPPFYFYTKSFLKLKEFLIGLKNCDVLKIVFLDEPDQVGFGDIDFDEEKLAADAHLGPPCDIRELKLTLSSRILSRSSFSAFLHGLFWTCHPRIFSLRVNPKAPNVTIEPLIRKLKDMANCLKHPLKRFEVEGANCSELLEARKLDVQVKLHW